MGTMREQRLYPVGIVMIMGKFDHKQVEFSSCCVVLFLLRCSSSPRVGDITLQILIGTHSHVHIRFYHIILIARPQDAL